MEQKGSFERKVSLAISVKQPVPVHVHALDTYIFSYYR